MSANHKIISLSFIIAFAMSVHCSCSKASESEVVFDPKYFSMVVLLNQTKVISEAGFVILPLDKIYFDKPYAPT